MTVLLPVLNGERWIAECLESLRVQSNQDFEVLIVDDGCTDNTISIAQSIGLQALRIIQGPGRGAGAARALGVSCTNSPFIATQDADDLSDQYRIEKQMNHMRKHPDCVIVGSWAYRINETGSIIGTTKMPKNTKSIRFAMHFNSPFVHSSTMLRKEAVVRAGNYPQGTMKIYADDYDLWSRMAYLGELHNIQEELVSYRINSRGVTGTQGQELRRQACAIAIRTSEATLGRSLSETDRRLFSHFFGRSSRVKVVDAFRLYRIFLGLITRSGFPPPKHGMVWRGWLSPIVWIMRSPRNSTPLWKKDERA